MVKPLMQKATAVWLIKNTALTFKQIAKFCDLHALEIQAIADGDIEANTPPCSPLSLGQLTKDEIQRGEADHSYDLQLSKEIIATLEREQKRVKKHAKYTSRVQRKDMPNAAAWIIQRHPNIKDAAVAKLLGMTKTTIAAIRDKSHWNYMNIVPKDPVILGLCTQTNLNNAVHAAAISAAASSSAAH